MLSTQGRFCSSHKYFILFFFILFFFFWVRAIIYPLFRFRLLPYMTRLNGNIRPNDDRIIEKANRSLFWQDGTVGDLSDYLILLFKVHASPNVLLLFNRHYNKISELDLTEIDTAHRYNVCNALEIQLDRQYRRAIR